MSSSLSHRKDTRSIETFEDNIKDFTEREWYWAQALVIDITDRGRPCRLENNGIDNTGKIIVDGTTNFKKVDYKIIFNDNKEMLVEIKTMPEWLNTFMTFKVSSLSNCIDQGAKLLVPKTDNYHLFSLTAISKMLAEYEHKIHAKFSPNDLSIRLPMTDIAQMVDSDIVTRAYWTDAAEKFIAKHRERLIKDKGLGPSIGPAIGNTIGLNRIDFND